MAEDTNKISFESNFEFIFNSSLKLATERIGKFIDDNDDYEWVKNRQAAQSYDHMSFRYKNKVFSVLVDIRDETGKSYLHDDLKQVQYKASLDYNMIPCIFPVIFTENYDKDIKIEPKSEGINLLSAREQKPVNPDELASNEETELSELEIRNKEINFVIDYLKAKNCSIKAFQDIVHSNPQIWYEDENKNINWLIIRSKTSDNNDVYPANDITTVQNIYPNNDGYYAELFLSTEGNQPLYRGKPVNIEPVRFEKIYDKSNAKTQKNNISEEDVYTLILNTINTSNNVANNPKRTSVYEIPSYENLLLRLPYALKSNIHLIRKELCLIPIKYKDEDLASHPRFGIPLYHIDSKDSEYAKRGYVTPQEVFVLDSAKIGLSVIKKMKGENVLSKYSYFLQSMIGQTGKTDFHDYGKIMQIELLYGKDAVIKTIENLKKGIYKVEPNELAIGSREFAFEPNQNFIVFYQSCAKNYLLTLKLLSDLPQETYNQALDDIISAKEFIFDFSNPTNVLIEYDKKIFNFIDFVFEDKYVDSVTLKQQITDFREALLGVYTLNLVQPENILYYPEEIELFENYSNIITEKINNAIPEDLRIEYRKREQI